MKHVMSIIALILAILMAKTQAESFLSWSMTLNDNAHANLDKKCGEALRDPDCMACVHDLREYSITNMINVSPDCCSALSNILAECSVIKMRNPFIVKLVSYHCPAPAAPLPL